MKKIIVFSTILELVLLNACDNAESPVDESQAPSISFTDVIGNLQISFLAGTESIAYTITNPVADGKLIPSASDSWITGYDTSTEGLLYFTVEENPAKEARSAILTLTYAYNGGNTSAQINVIQEASNAIVFEATYADGYYYGNQYTDNSMRYYTWLTENVRYDQRYYADFASMPYDSATARGALADHTAICGGYAQALQLLFEQAGIPCLTVSGVSSGENHMWNLALLDGRWLYFDATSDRGMAQFGFRKFAVTGEELTGYTWDEDWMLRLASSLGGA